MPDRLPFSLNQPIKGPITRRIRSQSMGYHTMSCPITISRNIIEAQNLKHFNIK